MINDVTNTDIDIYSLTVKPLEKEVNQLVWEHTQTPLSRLAFERRLAEIYARINLDSSELGIDERIDDEMLRNIPRGVELSRKEIRAKLNNDIMRRADAQLIEQVNDNITGVFNQATSLIGVSPQRFVNTAVNLIRGRDISAYYSGQLRRAFTEAYDNDLFSGMDEYDEDLLRVSAHGDTSLMCQDFQGKVYSKSGESEEYPPFESILFKNRGVGYQRGGGIRHGECRHTMSPYYEGFSDDDLFDKGLLLSDEQREEARAFRKNEMYARRTHREWISKRDKALISGADNIEYYDNKVKYWQNEGYLKNRPF